GSSEDWVGPIKQTSDGGYIVAGHSSSNDGDVSQNYGGNDYWIVKLDEIGNIEWEKSLGGSGEDIAADLLQVSDGGYIVVGYSSSNDGDVSQNYGGSDYWIVKLDDVGNIEWEKSLGGSREDIATSLQQTSDGGYIVAGHSSSNDGDVSGNQGGYDYWIVKLDNAGNLRWERSLGGNGDDMAYTVQQTSDGGYVLAGESNSESGDVSGNHGLIDAWIVKLDNSGNLEWQKSLGGSSYDAAVSIRQVPDGGYILSGYTASNDGDVSGNHGSHDFWMVKVDHTGNMLWQKTLGGTSVDIALYNSLTNDGGFIMTGASLSNNGDVSGNHGDFDYWIVKLSAETVGADEMYARNSMVVYPNPATDLLTVTGISPKTELSITNMFDEIILKTVVQNDIESIDISNLQSGAYIIQATTLGAVKINKKFIKH
ncbi:MAG: T9SS type A sorting domain-containing protein, partial [Bacteroidales bacterium]|nr:T9SS type A sorting domain-containing protein [Bacteroidales bacterium]